MSGWWRRIKRVIGRRQYEADLREELNAHLGMKAEELEAGGLPATEARRQAALAFGGVETVREECRQVSWVSTAESWVQDARYAARQLRRTPGFTLVTILLLALGLGGTGTLFTFTNAALLRPVPGVADPALLGLLGRTQEGRGFDTFSYPTIEDYRELTQSLDIAAHRGEDFYLSLGQGVERVRGRMVTAGFFQVTGTRIAAGRGFIPEEEKPGASAPVVLITHALWQRTFGGSADIVGRKVSINRAPFTIVGVLEPEFRGLDPMEPADLWLPLAALGALPSSPRSPSPAIVANRHVKWLDGVARLKPGHTWAEARTEVHGLAGRFAQAYPEAMKDEGIALSPRLGLQPELREEVSRMVAILIAIALLVMLVACANIANLLLARAAARSRDVAVRLSLGASRGRVIRQMLIESALLALAGGIAGLLLSGVIIRGLPGILPTEAAPLLRASTMEPVVLGAMLGMVLLTTAAFGILPAWQASRPEVLRALKEGEGGSVSGRSRGRQILVGAQVAASVLLLVVSSLLVRTLRNSQTVALGLEPRGVLSFGVDFSSNGYTREQGRLMTSRILEHLRSSQEVQEVALSVMIPLQGGNFGSTITLEGRPPNPGRPDLILFNAVSPGFFRILGMRVLAGRDLDARDTFAAAPVAVVNEAWVRSFARGGNPVGMRFQMGGEQGPREIVGVVSDAKYSQPLQPIRPTAYVPVDQKYMGRISVLVRGRDAANIPTNRAGSLAAPLRSALAQLDPLLPLREVVTLEQLFADALWRERITASFSSGFGALALLLAVLGIYGALAYSVEQRRREIGVRLALGASPAAVLQMVLRTGLSPVVVGTITGMAGAAVLAGALKTFLYGVQPYDPASLLLAAATMFTAAATACLLPARRATKVDPLAVLRHE